MIKITYGADRFRGTTSLVSLVFVAALAGHDPALAQETQLRYFTWGGYEDPALAPGYDKPFEALLYGDESELRQKLRAGFSADVIYPCGSGQTRRLIDEGLLEPLDPARIANWDSLAPTFRDDDMTKGSDGKTYLIPNEVGFSSVIYRSDLVTPTEESLAWFMTDEFKDRIALPGDPGEAVWMATALAGVDDRVDATLSDEDKDKVIASFERMLDQAQFIWGSTTEVSQALASGDIVASWVYSEVFAKLQSQGVPVKLMFGPKEGKFSYFCGFAVPKNHTASMDEIYDFINARQTTEAALAFMRTIGYLHPNVKAYPMLTAEDKAALGVGDDPLAVAIGMGFPKPATTNTEMLQTEWETVRALQ